VSDVHFVGIGGYGMSALAELALARGEAVSGCDARPNARSERLAGLGVRVFAGHDPGHLPASGRLVYSTDVAADLPELVAARARGLDVVHRSQLLAEALAGGYAIAVTGTHGKTTTSALTTHLIAASGLDPVGIVGGEVDGWGGGVRLGRGRVVVGEADESDASFLRYHPDVAVVTNVEPEHLEHYGGDFGRVLAAYARFVGQIRPGGAAVVWAEEPHRTAVTQGFAGRVRTFGDGSGADIRAADVVHAPTGSTFTVVRDGAVLGRVALSLPGPHNVRNALAAIEAALLTGARWDALAPALARFTNARRRFERIYEGPAGLVVDDYAHHPTEIRAVLDAARTVGATRVCAMFQPQRYVRTKALWHEFAGAFAEADDVLILDVYAPAGEAPIEGVSGEALARAIASRHARARYAPSLAAAVDMAEAAWQPGDLWLTMGAGDVWRAARDLGSRMVRRDAAGQGRTTA